jgi:hypothetical protein
MSVGTSAARFACRSMNIGYIRLLLCVLMAAATPDRQQRANPTRLARSACNAGSAPNANCARLWAWARDLLRRPALAAARHPHAASAPWRSG